VVLLPPAATSKPKKGKSKVKKPVKPKMTKKEPSVKELVKESGEEHGFFSQRESLANLHLHHPPSSKPESCAVSSVGGY